MVAIYLSAIASYSTCVLSSFFLSEFEVKYFTVLYSSCLLTTDETFVRTSGSDNHVISAAGPSGSVPAHSVGRWHHVFVILTLVPRRVGRVAVTSLFLLPLWESTDAADDHPSR